MILVVCSEAGNGNQSLFYSRNGKRKSVSRENHATSLAIKLPVIASPGGLRTLKFGHKVYLARNFTFANIVDQIGDTFY